MATKMSITEELYSEIRRRDYCEYVDLFPHENPMTSADLRELRTRTDDRYVIETEPYYTRKGKTKPEGIYTLFGKFINKTADETREQLVDWANSKVDEITKAGTVMLNHDNKDYSWWISNNHAQKESSRRAIPLEPL